MRNSAWETRSENPEFPVKLKKKKEKNEVNHFQCQVWKISKGHIGLIGRRRLVNTLKHCAIGTLQAPNFSGFTKLPSVTSYYGVINFLCSLLHF